MAATTVPALSTDERHKAAELIHAEVELWYRLARMTHSTEAERELFARNAAILLRVARSLVDEDAA